jgi:hypothetical protein
MPERDTRRQQGISQVSPICNRISLSRGRGHCVLWQKSQWMGPASQWRGGMNNA